MPNLVLALQFLLQGLGHRLTWTNGLQNCILKVEESTALVLLFYLLNFRCCLKCLSKASSSCDKLWLGSGLLLTSTMVPHTLLKELHYMADITTMAHGEGHSSCCPLATPRALTLLPSVSKSQTQMLKPIHEDEAVWCLLQVTSAKG